MVRPSFGARADCYDYEVSGLSARWSVSHYMYMVCLYRVGVVLRKYFGAL